MLKKLFRKNSKSETDLKPNEDTCSAEYIQYTQELEQTLSVLEAHLHESDNPDEIILHALETACDFYNGDWAGFLEIDLELGLWTPYIWFNKNPDDKTTIMLNEIESADFLYRWVTAMKNNLPIIVEDREQIKKDFPDEYEMYQRLRIHSVLAVPVKPRPTGFLAVRNPKRYIDRSSMLQMLAFVVLAIANEKKLLDSAKLAWSPENITNETDILFHLFGELEVYTSQGVLHEADLKSPKIIRLLAYMLLGSRRFFTARELAETLWPDEAFDQENPGKNIKTLIYRLRQVFSMISEQDLIESTPYGYRLNPKLNIMTDLQEFDRYLRSAQDTASITGKIDLLKKAVSVYRGNILGSAAGEHWLIPTSSHYNLKYLGAVNELLKTLAELKDYAGVHQYAAQALCIDPGNFRAYFWMIYSMYRQGATEMAKAELRAAEQHLTSEEYSELVQHLKKIKGLPIDIKRLKITP
ncbi:MAG: winged helix-turn-helix domain-containing protein [Cuneatibacter sp.]|nr:winged helix-turn-helix domain-containing protein [Cuneatibacter sp.]